MKKRIFLFWALAALAGGGVFAQTHFVSAEVNFLGGGARYEYVVSPYFTVGGYVTYSYLPTPFLDETFCIDVSVFGVGIAARWYPGGRMFFAELGMGYGSGTITQKSYHWNAEEERQGTASGFSLVPGFGWTIDIGEPGGFFISPNIRVPFLFTSDTGEMGLGQGNFCSGVVSIGIGYAF